MLGWGHAGVGPGCAPGRRAACSALQGAESRPSGTGGGTEARRTEAAPRLMGKAGLLTHLLQALGALAL